MDPEWLEALRRNSGLALTRDGVWTWGGHAVENPRVQAMFHRGVAVRADGEVTLSVGRMWAYIKTEGPAFFVRAVRDLEGGEPIVRLLGDRELPLFGEPGDVAPAAGWGPDERLYLWLAGVGGPAICLREAHQALSERLDEDERGLFLGLSPLSGSGGATDDRRIRVARLPGIPAPSAPRPA